MHDDDKLKLAREALEWIDYHKDNQDMSHLDFRIGAGNQASESLSAINALDPQLVEAVGLLREIEAQFRFYGDNHAAKPDPVKTDMGPAFYGTRSPPVGYRAGDYVEMFKDERWVRWSDPGWNSKRKYRLAADHPHYAAKQGDA